MIRLTDVHREFVVGEQPVHALDGVSLDIAGGDYVSIMGPSGSGKSTLLHVMGLLDGPNSGRYLLDGQDTTGLDDEALARLRRQRIGFVFQFFHLVPRLTAADNVELPLMLAGVPSERRRPRVEKALQDFGLADRADHRPDQLSGGQRQRVAIARAVIMEPRLLLADEPTGNLDRSSGHDVLRLLEGLHQGGITLIIVTHDPELGARSCRQIHMLDGRIVEDSGGRSVTPDPRPGPLPPSSRTG